jgi:hypothetical protein
VQWLGAGPAGADAAPQTGRIAHHPSSVLAGVAGGARTFAVAADARSDRLGRLRHCEHDHARPLENRTHAIHDTVTRGAVEPAAHAPDVRDRSGRSHRRGRADPRRHSPGSAGAAPGLSAPCRAHESRMRALRGSYGAVTLQVETHPDSPRVASLLLRIPGPDQTRALLPTVSRVLGAPHSQDRRQSVYGWDWPEYRAASLHYAPGGSGAPGQTIVSLFYR